MGSQALDDLRAEHRFMGKLLDLLQEQVRLIGEDKRPNEELLLEIAQYFTSFPDLFHHPKEDLIFHRLAALHPGAAGTIQALEAEHEDTGRELKRLVRAVVKLVLDPEADQDPFPQRRSRFHGNGKAAYGVGGEEFLRSGGKTHFTSRVGRN